MNKSKELDFLVKIVKKAGELIDDNLEVRAKDNNGDLVTNFDFEIENFLIAEIKKEYPDFAVVSEEYNSEKSITKNCFVIDPIDGTVNFAHGLPLWGIQIACIKDRKTCAAVISLPALGEFYEADESGAFLNEKRITVNKFDVSKGLCDIEGSEKRKKQPKALTMLRHIRSLNSSAVVFAWVAAGKLSAAAYVGIDKPWDYVPGEYLVEKAGGVTYDAEGIHLASNGDEYLEALKEVVA